jgi:electron transport complex protein RnfB
MITTVVTTAGVMFALSASLGVLLVIANVKLAVHVDPRQEEVANALPQANCGGCGYASCSAYAKAVHEETDTVDRCTVGGPPVAAQLAQLMGVDLAVNYPFRPVIHCGATTADRLQRGNYRGVPTCAAANVVGGVQGCTFGCLGLSDCVDSCNYDAMTLVDGLPRINYENCVGCGACVRACPRNIIEQIPFKTDRMLVVTCCSQDPGKRVREVCKVGCIGCSACSRAQPELFQMSGNLAVLNYNAYAEDQDFGPALAKCPRESLVTFGKPLPKHEAELAGVEAVTMAGRPDAADVATTDELDWRG